VRRAFTGVAVVLASVAGLACGGADPGGVGGAGGGGAGGAGGSGSAVASSTSSGVGGSSVQGTFALKVAPIFDGYCAGCHGGATPEHALTLGPSTEVSAAEVIAGLINVPSSELPAMPFVTPGVPSQSYLVYKITDTQSGLSCMPSCLDSMPPAGPPVPDEQITILRDWIEGGAAEK
jgi:hypothetical protein